MSTTKKTSTEKSAITSDTKIFVKYDAYNEKRKQKNQKRKTFAAIVKDNVISFGVTVCGTKDNFVRKVGKGIALQRAAENPILTRKLKPTDDIRKIFYSSLNTL